MRTVDEQLSRVMSGVAPLEPLDLALLEARGCLLAEPVTAPWALPPFDNAAVDGYAVRSSDVASASVNTPLQLPVLDDVPAGFRASQQVVFGSAIRVMAGAPMPEGADAVVPLEATDGGFPHVVVASPAAYSENVRLRGEDVEFGAEVIAPGRLIGARELSLLAAVGRGRVKVRPRPRVVVISTGSELVEPGNPLLPGLIPDSNGVMLTAAAEDAGAVAFRAGPIPDNEKQLIDTLEDQLVRADVVITTGGVSAGAYDTVKSVLSRLGSVEFTRVAMHPGMPQGHGRLGPDQVPIFTLPGNPVSAYVSFEVFVRPVIRRLLGHADVGRPVVRAALRGPIESPSGVRSYVRGILGVEDGHYVVTPVERQEPHAVSGLAAANCLIPVAEDVTRVPAGGIVQVMDLS